MAYHRLKGKRFFLLAGGFFILLLAFGWYFFPRRKNSVNVLLIVCDTLRADHLSAYGYPRDTSPHIDAFSKQSSLFLNAFTQAPCTNPSMWNIMMSRYQAPVPAREADLTLAEYFKIRNCQTAAFIAQQHLLKGKSNLAQGFDLYDDRTEVDRHGLTTRKAKSITDAAMQWLSAKDRAPFFIWLVYFDPHDPYNPPSPFRGYYNKTETFNRDRRAENIGGPHWEKGVLTVGSENASVTNAHRQFLINAYDEEIRYVDSEIGRLFKYLKDTGRYKNTLIIFTSDHGEELGDNGYLWDHCQRLTHEELHIPLIIKLPFQTKPRTLEAAVQNIDIFPTLVEFFDNKTRHHYDKILEGNSLLALLRGVGLKDPDRVAASFWKKQRFIANTDFTYAAIGHKNVVLHAPAGSMKPVDTAIIEQMKKKLSAIYKRYIRKKNYYEKSIRKLKSLGYL